MIDMAPRRRPISKPGKARAADPTTCNDPYAAISKEDL